MNHWHKVIQVFTTYHCMRNTNMLFTKLNVYIIALNHLFQEINPIYSKNPNTIKVYD